MGSAQNRAYRGMAGWRYASPPASTVPSKSIARRGSTAAAKKVAEMFAAAGIEIGGHRPWDIQIYDERFYQRLLSDGSLASGESYMDGWWEAEALDELCTRVHGADLADKVGEWKTIWLALKGRILNRQTKSRAEEVAQEHYNLGNDIYKAMLDRRMQYTCGYWKDATTLDEAQVKKLDLICRKIQLKPGMTVLELGGGFGGLAHFVATEYGCQVVSYNISSRAGGLRPGVVQGSAGPVRAEGLPGGSARNRGVRPCGFDWILRTHRRQELSRVPRDWPTKVETRRIVSPPLRSAAMRPTPAPILDGQIYFPQRDDSLDRAVRQGDGGAMGSGRLAQLRSGLRPDADGLVAEFRSRLAGPSAEVWRTVLSNVEILSPGLRRGISRAQASTLANRLVEGRRSRVHGR